MVESSAATSTESRDEIGINNLKKYWDLFADNAQAYLPASFLLTLLSIYNFFYDGIEYGKYKAQQLKEFYELSTYTFEDPVYYIYEDKFIPVRIYDPAKAPVSTSPTFVYYPAKNMLSHFATSNITKLKAEWIGATVHKESAIDIHDNSSSDNVYDITDWLSNFTAWLRIDTKRNAIQPFWVLQCWALHAGVTLQVDCVYVLTCMDELLETNVYRIRNGLVIETA